LRQMVFKKTEIKITSWKPEKCRLRKR
jgi:hypothetical protein